MRPNMASNGRRTMKVWRTPFGCSHKFRRPPGNPTFQNDCGNWDSRASHATPLSSRLLQHSPRAVDGHVRERGKRTDLGEMAQHAAAETLASLAGRELPSLFGPTP